MHHKECQDLFEHGLVVLPHQTSICSFCEIFLVYCNRRRLLPHILHLTPSKSPS